VEEQIAMGIPEDRIIIGGFSQGGAVALHTALTLGRKVGGILGMSTFLPRHMSIGKEMKEFNKTTPLLLCHGTSDIVLAYEWAQLSHGFLQTLRKENLVFKTYEGMGHTSCPEETEDVYNWISPILNK
jgi:predicted esterase